MNSIRKLFKFVLMFIPAYIVAMLLYTFVYQSDKTGFDNNIKSVISSGIEIIEEKINKLELDKKFPARNKFLSKLSQSNTNATDEETNNPVPEGKLTITMLDIKHGDAILLQDSKQTILIDTGHNANRDLVLKKLAEHNVKKINTVFVTHHHADHMGNIFQIAGKYGVGRIYDNGLVNNGSSNSVKLNDVLSKGNYKNKRLNAGDKISFGDGFYFDVLAPGDFMTKALRNDINNNSIVMKMHYGNFTMMFTGDIENPTEASIAEKYGKELKADILKVAHHGSRTSSNYQFVSKVKPKYALISCGDFAEYHHPNKDVVGRLQHLGAEVYNTNKNGNMTITTDGKSFEIKIEKK